MTSFESLGVSPGLTAALAAQGIDTPFPIQQLTIGDALAGRDVCGKAKTGSGKTLAFGLPVLQRVRAGKPGRPDGLVLVPTRELALQVAGVLSPLAKASGLSVACVYGGSDIRRQIKKVRRASDVVIATPGRLIDLCDRGELTIADVGLLVLDEADRMADLGFMPQVEWIMRKLEKEHQTLLFSATLDGEVDHLVKAYLRDPVRREVSSARVTVDEMEHRFLQVHELDKAKVLAALSRGAGKTLVFVRTKTGVDRLVRQLRREGVRATALHGDLRQSVRERGLADFSSGQVPVLVATDVAARGLHIPAVDIVVHYDPPGDHKSYLHRSGRTARAGETGVVVTLVLWDQVLEVERIQRRLGLRLPIVEIFSNDPRLGAIGEWRPGEDAA